LNSILSLKFRIYTSTHHCKGDAKIHYVHCVLFLHVGFIWFLWIGLWTKTYKRDSSVSLSLLFGKELNWSSQISYSKIKWTLYLFGNQFHHYRCQGFESFSSKICCLEDAQKAFPDFFSTWICDENLWGQISL